MQRCSAASAAALKTDIGCFGCGGDGKKAYITVELGRLGRRFNAGCAGLVYLIDRSDTTKDMAGMILTELE